MTDTMPDRNQPLRPPAGPAGPEAGQQPATSASPASPPRPAFGSWKWRLGNALAGVLAKSTRHFGHDTGISHLAAAVGVPVTVLFGPTDPAIWAPRGGNVRIVRAAEGNLGALTVAEVLGDA